MLLSFAAAASLPTKSRPLPSSPPSTAATAAAKSSLFHKLIFDKKVLARRYRRNIIITGSYTLIHNRGLGKTARNNHNHKIKRGTIQIE